MDTDLNDDGLKWFGEGFDGFPKRLPEDCVEYIIHIIDQKLEQAEAIRTRLRDVLKASDDLRKKHLNGYIWQRDAFDPKLYPNALAASQRNASTDDPHSTHRPHLRGRTNVGDSISDEWLIVYLLVELSKHFTNAWIRVYDTDGEFLLIEAASALPKWLSPEVAENRVWINNGHIKIIPMDEGTPARSLSQQAALAFIELTPQKLMISPFIEDEAFHRLSEYPSAISSSFHHALISIPRKLAHILHLRPTFISPAIEAFYLRDPVSLKPLATKDTSNLYFPPEDFVTTSIKFTKVGYAQIHSQIFDPPPAWTAVIPRVKDQKVAVGMKLTCGFEMLLRDSKHQDDRTVRSIKLCLEDLESGEDTLPNDADLANWPQVRDDEKWLDIDFNDFERELSGKRSGHDQKPDAGFGDKGAQENLRKMVSRFEDFLKDDAAGIDGVEDDDDENNEASDDTESDEDSSEPQDRSSAYSEEEFKKIMKEVQSLHPDFVEKSGLLDEARKLALEDAEGSDPENALDEDEEMKKVMELMERELKGHGALNLNGDKAQKASAAHSKSHSQKPIFGPVLPPHMESSAFTKGKSRVTEANATAGTESEEDIGPGDVELSSDDEDYNDVDLGLAKNMLEAFKGQAGTAGPAGNLMRAMGVSMPRDEGGEDEH